MNLEDLVLENCGLNVSLDDPQVIVWNGLDPEDSDELSAARMPITLFFEAVISGRQSRLRRIRCIPYAVDVNRITSRR